MRASDEDLAACECGDRADGHTTMGDAICDGCVRDLGLAEGDWRRHDKGARGLYQKFEVTRTDGSSAFGGRHHGCRYFVLDMSHDPHAAPALRAYADSCEAGGYAALAADLREEARRIEGRRLAEETSCG